MKNSGIDLTKLPRKYQDQIAPQLYPSMTAGAPPAPKSAKPRLRQSSKGPNRTEAAFASYMRQEWEESAFLEQAVTLVLANGVRYTADFFLPEGCLQSFRPVFVEVKGFLRDDAGVKIKVASRVHQWADFYLVTKQTKKQGGGWRIERVLP